MTFSGIILGVLLVSVIIQLVYMTILYTSFPTSNTYFNTGITQKVSIIIAAKNEGVIIEKTITHILDQSYPDFELIIADDFSTDNIESIVNSISNVDYRVQYLKVKTDHPGKRQALTEAIARATGSIILVTDADCVPNSDLWIKEMVSTVEPSKGLVLGIGPYYPADGWINLFARYENMWTTCQYISAAKLGIPYMGIGRNMMYSKNLFSLINGYKGQEHLSSGDDDLLVQKMIGKAKVTTNVSQNSFMYSKAENSIKTYLSQKKRHLSIATEYGLKEKVFLSIYSSTQMLIYFFGFFLLWKYPLYILTIYLIRWIVMFLLTNKVLNLLEYKDLKKWIPLLDIAYFAYLVYFTPSILFKTSTDWNEVSRADR